MTPTLRAAMALNYERGHEMTLSTDHPFRKSIRKFDGQTLWTEERYSRAAAREASRNGFEDIASWHRDRADAIADEMENRIAEMEGRCQV